MRSLPSRAVTSDTCVGSVSQKRNRGSSPFPLKKTYMCKGSLVIIESTTCFVKKYIIFFRIKEGPPLPIFIKRNHMVQYPIKSTATKHRTITKENIQDEHHQLHHLGTDRDPKARATRPSNSSKSLPGNTDSKRQTKRKSRNASSRGR